MPSNYKGSGPRRAFISYAHQDRQWLEELRLHLKPLQRVTGLQVWSDAGLNVGDQWVPEIGRQIENSQLAILLVSPHYLGSDYIAEQELPGLLERAKRDLSILWVPVSPCLWEQTGLVDFQAAWNPSRPLSTLPSGERDEALATIVRNVDRLLREERPGENRSTAPPGDYGLQSPRISRIALKNLRCFANIELDLTVNGEPSSRTMILGDNATGKTSLLRAIALGLCDESDTTALLKRVRGRFCRDDADPEPALIEVEIQHDGKTYLGRTEIIPLGLQSEVVRKEWMPSHPPQPLVVGYGTQRTKHGDVSHEAYSGVDAVATLFDNDAALQNPELVLRRHPLWVREQVEAQLRSILLLDDYDGEFEYTEKGIFVTGPWGRRPLEILSDGYRSTTQWILDFLSWLLYAGKISELGSLSGIVLIDELEQHLHPRWQRQIMDRLRSQLPQVQIIATTHSPLIAASVGAIGDEGSPEKLIHFARADSGEIVARAVDPLRGLTASQVLASPAFDYVVQSDPEVERILAEASKLASKGQENRTGEEESRYQKLKELMRQMLAPGETPVEREVRTDLHERMKERVSELEDVVFGGKP